MALVDLIQNPWSLCSSNTTQVCVQSSTKNAITQWYCGVKRTYVFTEPCTTFTNHSNSPDFNSGWASLINTSLSATCSYCVGYAQRVAWITLHSSLTLFTRSSACIKSCCIFAVLNNNLHSIHNCTRIKPKPYASHTSHASHVQRFIIESLQHN